MTEGRENTVCECLFSNLLWWILGSFFGTSQEASSSEFLPSSPPTSVGMNHWNESVTKFASLQAINPACEVPESITRLFTSFLALDLKAQRSNCSLDHSLLSTMTDLDRLAALTKTCRYSSALRNPMAILA